ncbi:MAG: hypothetical protein U5J64_05920 [Halobacteriales archaeon]|nr:hypothetical protein [Halobacteriales archaeon]
MSETTERDKTRVIGVDSDDADDLIGALSSETARKMLSELHDEHAMLFEVGGARGDDSPDALRPRKPRRGGSHRGRRHADSPKRKEMDGSRTGEPLASCRRREEDSTTRGTVVNVSSGRGAIGVAAIFVEYLFRLYAPTTTPTEVTEEGAGGDGGGMNAFDAESESPAPDGGAVEEQQEAMDAAMAAPTLVERVASFARCRLLRRCDAVALVVVGGWYVRNRDREE